MSKTRENQRFSVPRKFSKFSREAQGISINTIIIAAIALIVLVVLVAIFTGRIGLFSKGIGDVSTCNSLGGSCESSCTGERILGASDCDRDSDGDNDIENFGKPICCKR